MSSITQRSDAPRNWRLLKVLAFISDHGSISIDDAEDQLDLPRSEACSRLSDWVRIGRLSRVGRGVYVAASADLKAVG